MIPHPDIVLRILLAFLAGILIGIDRERHGKTAGTRTQMLICVGSAMLSSMSVELPNLLNAEGKALGGDPARLMAQVVAGIGFVGAGVVIKGSKNRVIGITTAAMIWVTAAIGLAIGAGFYLPAFITTCCVLLLGPIARLEYHIGLKVDPYLLTITPKMKKEVERMLQKQNIISCVLDHTEKAVAIRILSSEQRNRVLSAMLEKKRVKFSLSFIED